jgi:hypothetical protein
MVFISYSLVNYLATSKNKLPFLIGIFVGKIST